MKKNRDTYLRLNIIFAIIGQLLSLLINLISKNVLRSTLGVEYLGLQSIYSNFCDVFSFAFSGIGTAVLFHLYSALARDDKQKLASVYSYFDGICRKIALAVLAIGAVSLIVILFVVNADISALEIIATYTLYLLSIVIFNRYIFKQYYIIASQQRYLVTLIIGVCDSLALVAELACLYLLKSYAAFLACILLKNCVINLFLHFCLKKNFNYVFVDAPKLSSHEQTNILSDVKDLFVYRIGSVLVHNTDSIIISVLINTAMAGYYSNYQFMFIGISGLIGSFFEAIVAKIGHIISTKSKEEQFQSFLTISFVNLGVSSITATCFLFLAQDFVALWMGRDAVLPMAILLITVINLYFDNFHRTVASFRISAGIFKKVKKVILAKGILNIILSILFGKAFGVFGIILATVISDLVTMQWYEPHLVYQYFEQSILHEIFFQLTGATGLLACIAACQLFVSGLSGSTWLTFLPKAIFCALVTVIVSAAYFFICRTVLIKIIQQKK